MPNLLLVDDHAIVRTGLKMLIENFLAHSRIDEAQDGDSAFEKIKQNEYDLVIMDVTMPNTDSSGLINTILAIKPGMKIIMFSMNDEDIYARRYLKMGAMGYVKKNAAATEIKKAITMVLNNRVYVSEHLSEKLLIELRKTDTPENPFDKLSSREFEIVQHLVKGESVAEISQKLNLHTSTIGTHKSRIFGKLQCSNIIEIIELGKVYNMVF